MMDLVIPSMGPGALPPTGQVHCFQRAVCVAPDVPRTLIGRVR